jgi:PleD family two-component response regulator
VAQALTQACHRQADLVARYGGEEFVILLPETPRSGAARVARHVLAAVDALGIEHAASLTAGQVTVSVGVSFHDEDSADWIGEWRGPRDADDAASLAKAGKPADLLKAADLALYTAKQAGRARAWMLDAADRGAPARASELQLALA